MKKLDNESRIINDGYNTVVELVKHLGGHDVNYKATSTVALEHHNGKVFVTYPQWSHGVRSKVEREVTDREFFLIGVTIQMMNESSRKG